MISSESGSPLSAGGGGRVGVESSLVCLLDETSIKSSDKSMEFLLFKSNGHSLVFRDPLCLYPRLSNKF